MHDRTLAHLVDRPILPMLAAAFFVLTFAIKAFTDGPYVRGELSAAVAYTKYATAGAACLCALAHAVKSGEKVFVAEFNRLMLIWSCFAAVSLAMQAASAHFSTTTYVELVKFAMPILLAYCMLNALGPDGLYRCMVAVLVVSFLGYLVDLGDRGASVLSVFQADFSSSSSATESSGFAEIALMLSLYFMLVKKSRVAIVWATAFSVLTFKRLALVVVLTAFVISVFFPSLTRLRVPKRAITALKVGTLCAVALWFWMLLPGQEELFTCLLGSTPFEFTMGRSESMRYLLSCGFESYGFGSANDVVRAEYGVPFEMDLIKIAFELSPLVLAFFVWLYWDIAGTSFWGVFIVGYYMLNMITSDSLTSNFSFTLAYIVIGSASYASRENVWLQGAPSKGE